MFVLFPIIEFKKIGKGTRSYRAPRAFTTSLYRNQKRLEKAAIFHTRFPAPETPF